jgi:hypothetical protein
MRVAVQNTINSRRSLARVLTSLIAVVAVSGCAQGFEQVQSENRAKLFRLEVGQTRQQVLEEMGTEPQTFNQGVFRSDGIVPNPYDSETHLKGSTEIEVLYYVTNVQNKDGVITDDELTPLILVDGILVGWGWSYLGTFTTDNDLTLIGPQAPPLKPGSQTGR